MSFDATCFLSGLPIKHGDKVRFFIVKEVDRKHNRSKTIIHPDSLYSLVTMPISGEYYDYGAIEKIEHNAHTRHLEEMFQERQLQHDKIDFVKKYKPFSIEYYTQVIARTDNCIFKTGYSGEDAIYHSLCHEDAYRAVIRAEKMSLNAERERRHTWDKSKKPYVIKNKHTASWATLLSEEKEEVDNWNKWIRKFANYKDFIFTLDSAWGRDLSRYQERAKNKEEHFAEKYAKTIDSPSVETVFHDTHYNNFFMDKMSVEGSYNPYWFNELYYRSFLDKFQKDQLDVNSPDWQDWRQLLAEFLLFVDGMSNLHKFYVPFIYAPDCVDIDLNKFFNKAVDKIITNKKRKREE